MRSSLNALIQEGVGRAASWWLDSIGIIAGMTTAAAIMFFGGPAAAWGQQIGSATVMAIAMCAGAVLPLLWRVAGARSMGSRLAAQHVASDPSSFRSRFSAGVFQASNLSPERCSSEDVRRAAAHASAEFARFAARTAIPSTFVAFLAPVVALIGGWNVARLAGPNTYSFQSMAPSMIAGIACAAILVLLIELYVVAMRDAPTRWAASVSGPGATRVADHNSVVQSRSNDGSTELQPGASMGDAPTVKGMSLDEFRKLFDGPGTAGDS
jgi:hypothetical protein